MKGDGDQTGVSLLWENWWFWGKLYSLLGAAFLAEPCGIRCLALHSSTQAAFRGGRGRDQVPLSHWDGGFDTKSLLSGSSPNDDSPYPHLSLVPAPAAWPAIQSGG